MPARLLKMPGPDHSSKAHGWLFYLLSLAYCSVFAYWIYSSSLSIGTYLAWAGTGVVLTCFAGRTSVYVFEASVAVIAWFLLGGPHYLHQEIACLPLAAMVFAVGTFESGSHAVSVFVIPFGAAWFLLTAKYSSVEDVGWYGWIVVAAAAIQMALVSRDGSRPAFNPHKVIDLVLCSYSGNTAHYAQVFAEGMKRTGAEVRLHRFHYYPDFDASLDGDALVIAFPVVGWKPPWTMAAWMLFRMPNGRGRPAFILYTCAGGPENTSLATWLLLRFKGWRPVGRAWAVYPNNIVTARLGPRILYRFLDSLVPFGFEARITESYGERFARGMPSGQPHLVWAFPLFIIGPLMDNKYINIYPYRNHAGRKRCNACGICVRYCPVKRLTMRNGFPHASGTCTLCFGCVNLCPTRSMNIIAWSEYGQAYKPKYPNLVVKKNPAE
jgi:NAD-dependent dihydropyrimidine dehydrogenase PreA subunit